MEYVVQCRFSHSFTSAEPIQALFPNAKDVILFSFAFTGPPEFTPGEAARFMESVAREHRNEFTDTLSIDVEKADGNKGSVIVTLLVASVMVSPATVAAATGIVVGLGGIALWAADKVFGSALAEYGKSLTHRLQDRISPLDPKDGAIRDPQAIADERAAVIASERACASVPLAGGMLVNLSNRNSRGYKYSYQLIGALPGYVTVVVDQYAYQPVEYHVYETIPSDAR